jgi:PAS domain S-box-containing protein
VPRRRTVRIRVGCAQAPGAANMGLRVLKMSMSNRHQGWTLLGSGDVAKSLITRPTFGIRAWLAALVGFALLPIVLFSINEALKLADATQQSTLADLDRRTQSAATSVERHLVSLTQTAIALANSPAMLAGDQRESYEFAKRVMAASHSSSFATLIAPDGRIVFTTRRPFGEALPKVGDTIGYSAALATKAPHTSDLFQGTVAKSPLAAIWAPTLRNNEVVALTTVTIEPSELAALLQDEHLPDGWIGTVVDRRGMIAARTAAPETWIGTKGAPRTEAAGAQLMRGSYSIVDEGGVQVLSYFITLPSAGWQVIVSVPKEQFDAPINAAWRFMAALGLLSFATAGGLAWWFGHHVSQQIISVADDVLAMCAGRSPKAGRTGIRELDSASAALLAATRRLVSSERELRESEVRLQFVGERAEVGYWYWDIETDQLHWSPTCKQLFGIPVQDDVSYNRFLAAVHPDDRKRTDRAVRDCLESSGNTDYDTEYRIQCGDGTERWIHAKGSATFSGTSPVQMAGIALDISSRKQAEEAVRQSELRYRQLVEQMTDGIFVANPEGRYIDISPAGCEMLGMTHNELLGVCLEDLVVPEERHRIPHEVARFDNGSIVGSEWHVRRKDGSAFIGEMIGRKLSNGNIQVVLRDITERKRAEEHLKLLMREVNHRSRNMLAVVYSIARQTAASNVDDFIDRFAERIQALSANQDLLIKNDWHGANIEELVRAQLAPFADLIGTRIQVQGPHLRVTPSAAQSIGLALHELATNASKYGSLSDDRGRVDIHWRLDRDEFTMSWLERDGPCVEPPIRKGFGNIVLSVVAGASVEGKVDLDYPTTGFIWRLKCPVGKTL